MTEIVKAMHRKKFKRGDLVVYRKLKRSSSPGPRAKAIFPSEHGEQYSYQVDKFWVVIDSDPAGQVQLRTRRGKQHTVAAVDENLRLAHWWERLLYRGRFPTLELEKATPAA